VVRSEPQNTYGSSNHVMRLAMRASAVEGLNERLRGILQRLEV
jgi:hypothetical protein